MNRAELDQKCNDIVGALVADIYAEDDYGEFRNPRALMAAALSTLARQCTDVELDSHRLWVGLEDEAGGTVQERCMRTVGRHCAWRTERNEIEEKARKRRMAAREEQS